MYTKSEINHAMYEIKRRKTKLELERLTTNTIGVTSYPLKSYFRLLRVRDKNGAVKLERYTVGFDPPPPHAIKVVKERPLKYNGILVYEPFDIPGVVWSIFDVGGIQHNLSTDARLSLSVLQNGFVTPELRFVHSLSLPYNNETRRRNYFARTEGGGGYFGGMGVYSSTSYEYPQGMGVPYGFVKEEDGYRILCTVDTLGNMPLYMKEGALPGTAAAALEGAGACVLWLRGLLDAGWLGSELSLHDPEKSPIPVDRVHSPGDVYHYACGKYLMDALRSNEARDFSGIEVHTVDTESWVDSTNPKITILENDTLAP